MKDWHAWVYYCLYVWLYVCMTVWLYYCLHDCMYSMTECMYTCTVVYMHICMTVWFYVCMNICMYDCMYSSISGLYNVPVVIFRFEIIAPKCCIFICKNGSYNNYDGDDDSYNNDDSDDVNDDAPDDYILRMMLVMCYPFAIYINHIIHLLFAEHLY